MSHRPLFRLSNSLREFVRSRRSLYSLWSQRRSSIRPDELADRKPIRAAGFTTLWAFCTDSYLKACEHTPCGSWLKRLDVRFIKFLFVGFLNTLFGYSMYAIGVALGLSYSWALLVSYTLGVFWNFKTTGGLVFKNKNNRLILKFCCVYVVTLSINLTCLRFLVLHNVNKYLAQALLVLPVAVLSFILFKYMVFKKECEA